MNTKNSDTIIDDHVIYFILSLALSLALALFWGVWWLVTGNIPDGLGGWSRWWDLFVLPLSVVLSAAGQFFFWENDHPRWVLVFADKCFPTLCVLMGIASVLFGIAVLGVVFLEFLLVFLVLQVRLTVLGLLGRRGYDVAVH